MERRRRRKKVWIRIGVISLFLTVLAVGIGFWYWKSTEQATCSPQLTVELQAEKPEGVIYEQNIRYAETEQNLCYLDIAYSEEEAANPLLVFVHGGSWMEGSRTEMTNYLYTFSALGYTVATIDYDLLDFYDYLTGEFVSVNDQVGMVSEAISYLTDNAEKYHIDTEKIVLIGHSAGGQLVGCLAERVSDHPEEYEYQLAGVVILAGVTDLKTMLYEGHQWEGNVSLALVPFIFDGVENSDVITEIEKVDVASNITEKLPPVLLVHGNNDTLVPLTMSENLYQSLKDLGVDTELVVVEGMSHGLEEQAVSNAIYTYLTVYVQDLDEENK